MWNLILIVLGVFAVAAATYVTARVYRFSLIKRLAEKHKIIACLTSLLPIAAVGLFALINVFAMIVVLIHGELYYQVQHIRKNESSYKSLLK